ncbi:MAG: acyltransferase [Hallerella porci]|uniref:Peptidoglycan/LPS O-acetylase OafA/YrhL n=1 Tax=Hallerella porci TaxID=1945871 RepID=A0ABX5LNV7_9BACT|nr:acyltransferase [Hallerella porci]MDY3920675.1 acyltransferase [Hallerella porci]PWL01138.1 peptidoglycan/LPS O-acetylase OafA/YrhL [Hallerella porci]
MNVNGKSYFPAIDGLRLLASLNIVMLHLSSSSALGYMSHWNWIFPVVTAPAFAAGLFFILAGFLFGSKFNDPDRRMPVIPFMFARIAKLYRCHFAMTVLMFAALYVKLGGFENMFHPLRSFLMHATLTWTFLPQLGMKLNEPSWSLTAFFVCYAITPFCARFFAKIESRKILWIFCGLVFIPGIAWGIFFEYAGCLGTLPLLGDFSDYNLRYQYFHMFPFVRIFEYLFGMILFRLYKSGAFDFLQKNYVAGILQIALLGLLYASLFTMKSENVAWNFICHHSVAVLIYGGLIVSITTSKGWLSKIFCIPMIRSVGRASFYPYLIHLPLITIAWSFCNLNRPLATVIFLLFIYTISTLYQNYKTAKKKRLAAK